MTGRASRKSNGFTIVELLSVIVIVAILAAITVVAFSSIKKRATVASIQSDMKNAKTQLEMFKVSNELYPKANNCAANKDASKEICINFSAGNEVTYIPSGDRLSYQLVANNGDLNYLTSESTDIGPMVICKQISAGSNHTCAISSDDFAYCWGDNTYGQLGDGTNISKLLPTKVQSTYGDMLPVKSISAGSDYTCAITLTNNRSYCWGNNSYGKLGDETYTNRNIPMAVYMGGSIFPASKSIIAGTNHTCAILLSGSNAYCWGDNTYGQLGNKSNTSSKSPVYVKNSTGAIFKSVNSITVGASHTCAIGTDYKAYCWGKSDNGRLGIGPKQACGNIPFIGYKCTDIPAVVPDNVNIPTIIRNGDYSGGIYQEIAAGLDFTCAIGYNKITYCWGNNTSAQLGNVYAGLYALSPVSTQIGFLTSENTAQKVSANSQAIHTCISITTNRPFCWGSNDNGQLGSKWLVSVMGYNFSIPVSVAPTPVNKDIIDENAINLYDKQISAISVGREHTCAIDLNGWAYCWGLNSTGQLGSNSNTNSEFPIRVRLVQISQ